MSHTAIDQAVFDGLKETIGADYIGKLVSAFLQEAPTLIRQLRPALNASDTETFRRAVHSVKSNAATFGATHLFELTRELEFMSRENRLEGIGDRLEILGEEFTRVAKTLEELSA